jgi:hypothetical protein
MVICFLLSVALQNYGRGEDLLFDRRLCRSDLFGRKERGGCKEEEGEEFEFHVCRSLFGEVELGLRLKGQRSDEMKRS